MESLIRTAIANVARLPLSSSPTRMLSSVFFILLAFILSSSRTHSQYFDIGDGESQSSPSALKGEDCSLPSAWEGSWFQSGVHSLITINNRSLISTKGQCIETDGDKFLFYNQVDKCFRCLVFHEKHPNVLQYKETYCHQSRRSLRSLCSTIQADYHLMSMFRLDAVPVPCPFHGAFTLSYNRGYGNCQLPVSTLNSCIHPTRIVFNYQACPDIYGTESATEEVECFATWKESSSRYLLGLIRYHYPASYEERFRCFVYEKEGTNYGPVSASSLSLPAHGPRRSSVNNDTGGEIEVYRVAQSGDATCLGLTPTEGSKTLVLRKTPQPKPCQFPSWLQRHTHWESLSREMIYEFEANILRIGNYSVARNGNGLLTQAVCTQIIQHENTNQATATGTKNNSENLTDKITLVLHSTSDCQTGFMCSTIYKREDHIIELQTGRLSRTLENACHQSYFDPAEASYITLTSPTPESRECPFLTTFDITSLSLSSANDVVTNCKGQGTDTRTSTSSEDTIGSFSMGCDKLDMIELETSKKCATEKYKCLGWWEEASGENYLVVSSSWSFANNSSPGGTNGDGNGLRRNYERRSCFVFYETTAQELSSLSLLHSSSSSSSSHGRKNQEINLAENDQDDDNDDDGDGDEDDDTRQGKESQQKRNLRRQFHFVRFEESCERQRLQRPQPQRRKLLYADADDEDDGVQIGLVFNASTSYYYENNCHTAASSRKSDEASAGGVGSIRWPFSDSIFAILLVHPVLMLTRIIVTA